MTEIEEMLAKAISEKSTNQLAEGEYNFTEYTEKFGKRHDLECLTGSYGGYDTLRLKYKHSEEIEFEIQANHNFGDGIRFFEYPKWDCYITVYHNGCFIIQTYGGSLKDTLGKLEHPGFRELLVEEAKNSRYWNNRRNK